MNKILTALISQPDKQEYVILPGEETKGTTIRLEADIRKFSEDNANKLGISIQSFISMLIKGVMLETTNSTQSECILMSERIIEIFKSHSIDLISIPKILNDYHITLPVLAEKHRILEFITPSLIKFLSDTFFASQHWIQAQSNIYAKAVNWK